MLLGGCGETEPDTVKAALVISGGPILTMEGDTPSYAEAVLVRDGKIAFVGSEAEAKRQAGSGAELKDLAGKVMLPGFIDPHSHFMDSLTMSDRVNVSAPPVGPASTPDEIVAVLRNPL
ncbi:hypothetical protein ASD76_07605 [Altererythrobacter sp. Root672]|nr:hypothetical protein ASD76_07605 [Altererythrobacter sp. Root672]